MTFYIYIIYNIKHDKFYIGQSIDLNKRIIEHNEGLSNYTSKYDGEWILCYHEEYKSRSEAIKRERFFKKQKNKVFYKKLCSL